MSTGIVKWFDEAKKFGFIVPDIAGEDIFVHISSVSAGCSLAEGDQVSYDVGSRKGKSCAINVKIIYK